MQPQLNNYTTFNTVATFPQGRCNQPRHGVGCNTLKPSVQLAIVVTSLVTEIVTIACFGAEI